MTTNATTNKPPKVRLGARPGDIQHTLIVDLPDGTKGTMPVIYVYRTRKEFGALIDEMAEASRREAEQPADAAQTSAQPVTVEGVYDGRSKANAQYLGRILSGWGLDEPFGPDALAQLCDELPGAAAQIIEAYNQVITEGRLGN